MPLFFGEIHIHTALSDGEGSPSQNLRYAHDVVGLDFSAITDHAEDLNREKWKTIKQAIKKYNCSGNFITLLGFEWTHPSGNRVWESLIYKKLDPSTMDLSRYGHRNVYYRGIEGNYYYWNDPRSNTPEKLWDQLEKQNLPTLVIPHHPASYVFPVDWDSHNPDFERLVEIYSIWGSSEMPESEGNTRPIIRGGGEASKAAKSHVQHALNQGCQLGIIAGSDGHDGYGGQTRHHIHNLTQHEGPFYPSGITGIYASELTRKAIWDALWNRYCYGTTGPKIKLQFSVNGAPMGSEIQKPKDSKLHIESNISGTADIQKIDLVQEGTVVEEKYGDSPEERFEFIKKQENKSTYYYLRIIQTDGEMAWSSPIWVN